MVLLDMLNSVCLQRMKEERERQLALSSFTSDLQIKRGLDEIAGTTGTDRYERHVILEFLRKKGWVIEEIDAVPDAQQTPARKLVSLYDNSASCTLKLIGV